MFRPAVEKLEIIECDLENQGGIGAAIGNASIVICCIGASEKEVFDITGPYRIDYKATENLINAGTEHSISCLINEGIILLCHHLHLRFLSKIW